jgi:ribose transport system substrate-binding protein
MNFSVTKKLIGLFAFLIVALALMGCNRQGGSGTSGGNGAGGSGGGKTVVGFSQMENNGPWRIAETKSMRDEAAKRADKYELATTDAQAQTSKQVSDVEDLVARGVKAIFSPPANLKVSRPLCKPPKNRKFLCF